MSHSERHFSSNIASAQNEQCSNENIVLTLGLDVPNVSHGPTHDVYR
jgi:hypothetical protein